MSKDDLFLFIIILFASITIGIFSNMIDFNDLSYELEWSELKHTKVCFQDCELKVINNYSKTGTSKSYEEVLKVITPENENLEVKVHINAPAYSVLYNKEELNKIEKQFKDLNYNEQYTKNKLMGDVDIATAIEETKGLRYTEKGDTLLIHHSGNIKFPYTIQNISKKSVLVEKQGENRLNVILLLLGVCVFMIVMDLFLLYALLKSKPTKNI